MFDAGGAAGAAGPGLEGQGVGFRVRGAALDLLCCP